MVRNAVCRINGKKKKHTIKGSTTSVSKLQILKTKKIEGHFFRIQNNQFIGNLSPLLNSDTIVIAVPFGQQKENLVAYQKLANCIENTAVKKVIFISSTAVYADTNGVVTETSNFAVNPLKEKLVTLENIFLNGRSFDTIVIRFAGLIGGTRNPGNFFRNKTEVPNGLAPINLIHLDDCLKILEKLCFSNFKNEVFNAATDTHPTRKDFYTKAITDVNRTPPVFMENKNFSYKIISNAKLKERLKYTFIHADLMQLKF